MRTILGDNLFQRLQKEGGATIRGNTVLQQIVLISEEKKTLNVFLPRNNPPNLQF